MASVKKIFIIFASALFLFALPVFGQEQGTVTFTLKGVIRDKGEIVLPGVDLTFTNGTTVSKVYTDENGEFNTQMQPGEWVLTSGFFSADDFRVFVRIGSEGLNPGYLDLVVDWEAINCAHAPKPVAVVRSSVPGYPAVAAAVHAVGEVEVKVLLAPDGSVSSANAVSGHPLLRKAAENAAAKFIFEPAEGTVQRNSEVVFLFLTGGYEKPGLKRISFPLLNCPFRSVVFAPSPTIN